MLDELKIKLSPSFFGGYVLLQIFNEKKTGVLKWRISAYNYNLYFKEGKPQSIIYQDKKYTDKTQLLSFFHSFAIMNLGECGFFSEMINENIEQGINVIQEIVNAILNNVRKNQIHEFININPTQCVGLLI